MPDNNYSTNHFTVRWSDELIKHLSTEGRTLGPGETIRVTNGLPEDANLVEVSLSDRAVSFTFESKEIAIAEETIVKHSVEHAYGKVPVAAIRLALGAVGKIEARFDELDAAKDVSAWLKQVRSGSS